MQGLRLKVLDLGDMTFSKNELIQVRDPGEMVVSPALAVLIHHPEAGYLLYDTGNDPDWYATYSPAMKQIYPISRLISIRSALAAEGLTPEQISLLALSHLHFDHAGGLRQFAGTRAGQQVVVARAELDFAVRACREEGSAYIAPLFHQIPGISFRTVSGPCALAQGVTLLPLCCHTPGIMGLQVELASGTVLFTSDTVYTQEAFRKRLPPGGAINSAGDFLTNLQVLEELAARLPARLFFGHDIQQARQWQAQGWIS